MNAEPMVREQTSNPKSILLVEDEVLIAMAEKSMLESAGYHVVCAASGEKALEISRNDPGIDLALMDIDLGYGMDGTEAAARILQEHEMPIVFWSSHIEPEIIEKTEKTTAYGYIVKNSNITAINASIKMAFKLFDSNQKLHLEKEHLRTTFHSIGDAVVSTDIDSNIVRMNAIAESLSGWTLQEAEGKPFSEVLTLIDAFSRDPIEDPMHKAIMGGSGVGLDKNTILVSKNGTEYQIEDSCVPIRDMEGRISGVVLVFRDITETLILQEALRESEGNYRRLFDEHSAIKMVIEIDTGNIVKANKAAADYYGWSCEELKGMNIRQISALPDDEIKNNLDNAMSRDGAHYKTRHRKEDGSIRDLEVFTNLVVISGKRCVHSIFIDVTDRILLEAEVLRSNEAFDAFFAHSAGILNLEDEGFHYLKTDSITPTYFGLNRESIVGKAVGELAPDFMEEYGPMMRRVIETGEAMNNVELRSPVPARGGAMGFWQASNFLVNLPGGKTGIGIVGIDISDRKAAEEALLVSEKKFRTIVDATPVGISVVNEKHETVFSNPALGRILDMADEGLLRGDYEKRSYLRADATQMPNEEFASVRSTKERKPVHDVVTGVVKEDGSTVWTNVSSVPVSGIPGWDNVTVTSDITQCKVAEERTETLLAEKNLILREVHHRLKNNSSLIATFLNLQREENGNEAVKRALSDAVDRIQSMGILYTKLYQSDDFGNISLSDYLPDLVDHIIATFSTGVRIRVEKRVDGILVSTARIYHMGIIVNELITNIMKYAFAGRTEGTISVSACRDGGKLILEVQDDGVGLPESFDFEDHSGFGMRLIGLLTAQLKGRLRIERGGGTKVVLEFPL